MKVSDAVRKFTKAELQGHGQLEVKVLIDGKWYTVQDVQFMLDNAVMTVKED